jgi:hypothetical protein
VYRMMVAPDITEYEVLEDEEMKSPGAMAV